MKNKYIIFIAGIFSGIILLFITILFINLYYSDKKHYDSGARFKNLDYYNNLIQELKKNNIPYKEINEGYVQFPKKYEKQVEELIHLVLQKIDMSQGPSMQFTNYNLANSFIKLLKKRNISYTVREINPKSNIYYIHVIWDIKDDPVVQEIIKIEFPELL